MRNKFVTFGILITAGAVGALPVLQAQQVKGAPAALEERAAPALTEGEREKEMLKIWKTHVRTLTQERDEANRQIEELKASVAKLQAAGPESSEPAAAERESGEVLALRQRNEEAVQKLRSFQQQLDELTARNKALEVESGRQGTWQSQRENLVKDNDNLRARVLALETEQIRLQTELKKTGAVTVDTSALRLGKEQAEAELEQMRQQTRQIELDYGQLRAERDRLAQEAKKLRQTTVPARQAEDTEWQGRVAQAQLERLKLEQAEWVEARTVLNDRIAELEALVEQSAASTRDRDAKLEEARQEIERRPSVEEWQKAQTDLRQLQQDKEEAYTLIQDLKTRLASLENQSTVPPDAARELAELRDANRQLSEQKQQAQLGWEQAQEKVGQLEARVASLEAAEQELGSARSGQQTLREELDRTRQELESALAANRKAAEWQESLAIAEKDKAAAAQSLAEAQRRLQESALSIESQKLELEKARMAYEELDGLREQKEQWSREREQLTARAEELRAQVDAFGAQTEAMKSLEAQLVESRQDQEKAAAERKRLMDEIERAEARVEESKSEGERAKLLDEQLLALQEKLDAASARQVEADKQIKYLTSESEILKAKAAKQAQTQQELDGAKAKLEEVLRQAQDIHESSERRDRALAESQQTVQRLKDKLEANRSDLQNLKTNVDSYLESLLDSFEERKA